MQCPSLTKIVREHSQHRFGHQEKGPVCGYSFQALIVVDTWNSRHEEVKQKEYRLKRL